MKSLAYREQMQQTPLMRILNSHPEATDGLSLARLPIGAQARVIAINGSGTIARRLMEMGVVPGAPVRVIKAAPLGDPIEIRVRGYHLALRRTEAQTILVTITSDE
ncbi:MAG: ferrous iron transport protein [Acidobacteriota bacterium]|jgi:Fe2+ transport system protein FeoA|nr:ferrous iron transport protein [Acidobacteriota bacterium]